jgi:hypothetical protein
VGLAEQWERIAASLPQGWLQVELRLRVRSAANAARAAALLGPLQPGRTEDEIHLSVSRRSGVGPDAARRLFANLDDDGISGNLALASTVGSREALAAVEVDRRPLADQWNEAVADLPPDWSDLLCRLELTSSDDLPRAALLAAPLNPSRPDGEVGFEFRVARNTGYGASPQMARRCLERVDESGIRGTVEVLRALSDTKHVSTQGPVWYVGGKVL